MRLTQVMLKDQLYYLLKKNAPARQTGGPRGKPGTNMYSDSPGHLIREGITRPADNQVVLDLNRVGYIWYANLYSKRPNYIENSVNEFLQWLVSLGGRIV